MIEDGLQRVPPRGVRSYIASSCMRDLGEGEIGIGASDASDEGQEPLAARSAHDGTEQVGFCEAFGDEAFNGAFEVLDAPSGAGRRHSAASRMSRRRGLRMWPLRPRNLRNRQNSEAYCDNVCLSDSALIHRR